VPVRPDPDQLRARDAALRRTRAIVAGVVAGAVGLSGLISVVAAQAFKGRAQAAATPPATAAPRHGARRLPVSPPQAIPSIAGDTAPLQPPEQPPADAQPSAPAPQPQESGGS
jgi:hypothetical protein